MYLSCEVLDNSCVCDGYWRIKLRASGIANEALPGQFIMLKCQDGYIPFFMRPFSINSADAKAGTIDIIYKVVGAETKLMTQLMPGASCKVMGPLGHGFPVKRDAKRIALIGRGVGAAPMLYLAQKAVKDGIGVYVYLSACSEENLFNIHEYRKLGCKVRHTTDQNVLVTEFFEQDLNTMISFDAAYVCGSKRLMRDTERLMRMFGFQAYASVEEHMACGVGACKGCICTVHEKDGKERFANVCREGPVFPLERLVK